MVAIVPSVPDYPRSFDLSDVSRGLYVKWLRFKWGAVVCVTVASVLAAASLAFFAVEQSLAGRFQSRGTTDLALVAFFGLFAFLFWFVGNARVRHPATGLEITQDGVYVKYRSGAEARILWSNPSLRLKIGSMYAHPLQRTIRTSFFVWRPRLFMPDEAADAIIDAARQHGLNVQVVTDPGSTTGESVLIRPGP